MDQSNPSFGRRLVKLPWIIDTKEMSRSSVYRAMENEGFPKPIRTTGRSVAWFFDEVEDWFANRPRGINPCAGAEQYQTEDYLTSRPAARDAA